MVDERRLRRLLQRISDDLAYLSQRAREDRQAILEDIDRLAALKYYFLTAIEGCLDVAQHLCASEGWGPPSDNADSMRHLAAHGVLDDSLADTLVQAVRFRNLLIHEYAEIDDERVVAFLDRVGDLEGFVSAIARLIGG